jgi:hypothetical protein
MVSTMVGINGFKGFGLVRMQWLRFLDLMDWRSRDRVRWWWVPNESSIGVSSSGRMSVDRCDRCAIPEVGFGEARASAV